MRSCVRLLWFVLASLTLAIGTLSIANAFPVTWVLNGATFTDGGTATGSFVYDADTNTLSNWSVAVAGGDTTTYPPITYDTTTSSGSYATSLPTTFGTELDINASTRRIRMPGTSALSDAGGTIPISTAYGLECYNCAPSRLFASGNLVGTAAPAITSANAATFTVGAVGSFTVTSTGAPTSALAESGTLPSGVSFVDNGDGTATLSGTPTAAGSFPITITASNGVSPNATQNFTLTVNQAPTITSASSTTFTVGAAGSFTVTSTGFPTAALSESGALPAGVTFVDNGNGTATISGTPTSGGSYPITITANNGISPNATQTFTLTVNAPTITLSPATLPAATVGMAYSQTITASGGTAPYTYAVTSGALPAGLTLSSAGVLSGTPTAGGSFTFTVTATDSSTGSGPYTGSRAYTLTVNPPTITLSPATLPAATVAAAYSQTITASGGTASYTFAVTSGALPAGLTLSSAGVLSGTPTAGGPFTFTVTATDSSTGTGSPYTGSQAYTLTVNAPTITLTPTTLPGGTNGVAYPSQTITASGGTATYTYAVTAGALPGGLTLSSGGVLSGTPNAGGTFNFTVTATDSSTGSGPYTGSQAYSVVIAAGTQTITITAPNNIYLNLGPATVTATASSGLPVTLTTSTPTICSVSGTGPSFTVTLLAAGTCTLNAAQAGDVNFLPATATANILVVAAPVPTPTLGSAQLLALVLLLGLFGYARLRRA